MLNKFDKPAGRRTDALRWGSISNLLATVPDTNNFSRDFRAELDKVLKIFRECGKGKHRGPLSTDTPHCIVICFESFAQREAFRKALGLLHHGDQYWAAKNFFGSLELLRQATLLQEKSFAPRVNPFARETAAKSSASAEKYSMLREEVKKAAAKLQTYTEDRTWIALCFDTKQDLAQGCHKLGLLQQRFVHIEDMLAAIQNTCGVTLKIPLVPFALRAKAKPDKALNALAG